MTGDVDKPTVQVSATTARDPLMENWNITIKAPTGEFDATLTLVDEGGVLAGEMAAKGGNGPMQDLILGEEAIAWFTKVERPMPMKLKFRGTRDGDTMNGTVKFGLFASGTFSGSKT